MGFQVLLPDSEDVFELLSGVFEPSSQAANNIAAMPGALLSVLSSWNRERLELRYVRVQLLNLLFHRCAER